MDSNESKPTSPAPAEPVSADRRAFMKTVVTGTVAAGLVATVGKAEAATVTCEVAQMPPATVSARLILNANADITRQHIIDVIGGIFDGSNCPACGLIGIPDDPRHIKDIRIEKAYLAKDITSMVVFSEP